LFPLRAMPCFYGAHRAHTRCKPVAGPDGCGCVVNVRGVVGEVDPARMSRSVMTTITENAIAASASQTLPTRGFADIVPV
jgi:hypothetical protein